MALSGILSVYIYVALAFSHSDLPPTQYKELLIIDLLHVGITIRHYHYRHHYNVVCGCTESPSYASKEDYIFSSGC